MPFPPNLFLIGAQKAGTTYLANLLEQHKDICASVPKEPAYLTRNHDKGLEWYRSRFSSPNARFLLDATTGYTSSPLPEMDDECTGSRFWGVPQRLKELSPDALLIYIARDPVSRCYSAYWHEVRAGHETRPFRDALREDSYYLRTSRYFDQLALYRAHFPRDRILVLTFEALVADPTNTVGQCFSFLSLSTPSDIETDQGTNRSFTYPPGLTQVNRMLSRVGGLGRIAKSLRPYLPSPVKRWLTTDVARKIPPILPEDAEYLAGYFAEANRMFADEYGIDIGAWRVPG